MVVVVLVVFGLLFVVFGRVFGRWGIPYHSLFDFNQIWWFVVVLLVLFVFAVLVVLVVFGKAPLGHSVTFPLISIRFVSFWWFW